MFGFGSSKKDDIFGIDDIRELVLAFPQQAALKGAESSSKERELNALVPLESGNGVFQLPALSEAFHQLLEGKYGRLPVSALATHLDVSTAVLLQLAREAEDIILSASGEYVFTRYVVDI
jgi:hypothetical protein